MNRRLGLCIGLTTLLAGSVALAQEEVTIGYTGLPYKSSGESNTGVQLSEGTLLHAGVGVEAGYDTNVFYSDTNARGSSIVRVLPFVDITNATRNGPASQAMVFDVRAGLQYRYYGSSDPDVKRYSNAWNPNAGVSLSFGGAQVGFGIADVFARIEDAPYAGQAGIPSTGPLQRNNNQASAEVRWAPGGGRLTGTLRFTNMVDLYDETYNYANALTNTLMLDASWKWLPKTAVFFNATQGWIYYLNNSNAPPNTAQAAKNDSYPLHVTVGLRGLLTEKTSAILAVGYMNAFYSDGGSTGGFLGSTFAELSLTVRPTQLSRIVLGGRHDFLNSVISNFALSDTVYLSYIQQIAGRLALDLSGRYQRLDYQGQFVDTSQTDRVDNLFQVGAVVDYFLRNWAYIGVGYSVVDNRSNIPIAAYLKQQIFARLGVTY
jgi:Putative beta-barrel porin 2